MVQSWTRICDRLGTQLEGCPAGPTGGSSPCPLLFTGPADSMGLTGEGDTACLPRAPRALQESRPPTSLGKGELLACPAT